MNKNDENNNFRRIQFTGGSSYIVSLPKDWIQKQRITKGSIVEIIQLEDSTISIKPKNKKNDFTRKALIKVTTQDSSERIIKHLISTYIQGYNIIQIYSDEKRIDPSIKNALKNVLRKNFVGTEILDDSINSITLQIVLSYKDLTINDVIQRMAMMTTSMYNDTFLALKIGDKNILKDIISVNEEIDRFSLYTARLLTQAVKNPQIVYDIGLTKLSDCLSYRLILKSIEKIANHASNIANIHLLMDKQISDSKIIDLLSNLGDSVIKGFEAAIDSVVKRSYVDAEKVTDLLENTQNKIMDAIFSIDQFEYVKNYTQLPLIMEIIKQTLGYEKDIIEMVLNMTINDVVAESL